MTLVPVPQWKVDFNKLPDTFGRFGAGLLDLTRGVRNVFDARKVTDLAADLMSLAFWHDGMRQEIIPRATVRESRLALTSASATCASIHDCTSWKSSRRVPSYNEAVPGSHQHSWSGQM